MVLHGINTICEKFWGKKDKEFERDERETKEEGEMREKGAGSPFLFFLIDLGTLERRGSRLSMARF